MPLRVRAIPAGKVFAVFLTDLPGPLRWAVWLLTAEAVVATAVAGFLGYQGLAAEPASLVDALALAGYVALLAAGLAGVAVALARRKPRARAPAIVLQLLLLMFAYVLATGGSAPLGVPLAVLCIAIVTLLLTPSTNRELAS